jgi:hypothetical protein
MGITMFRIGGWQRIGIVLSVGWIVAGPIYLNNRAYNEALEYMGFDYRTCRDAQGARDDPAICTSQSKETFEISIRDNVTPLGTTRWAWWLVFQFCSVG